MDVDNVYLKLSPGAFQGMEFIEGLPFFHGGNRLGDKIPLASFSYSCSLGVQPSSGSLTISGKFLGSVEIQTSNLEDAEIVVETKGDEFPGEKSVHFQKLKINDFNWTPLDAPEGEKRIYTVTFEDQRWRLQKGGVFGYFNKVLGIKEDIEFLTTTLNTDLEPWTYLEIIQKVAEDAGIKIDDPRDTSTEVSGSRAMPQITIDAKAFNRLDEFPMNKDYRGQSPADVIAELAQEIGLTISIRPDGTVFLTPFTGKVSIPPRIGKSRGADSSAGIKYKPIPDKVYLVGGRVRDQIRIEPNLAAFDYFEKRHESGMSNTIAAALNITEGDLSHLSNEDLGLEPVCPDISGRIRNFYDLIKQWDLTFSDIARVYQAHSGTPSPKSVTWEMVISGTGDTTEEYEEVGAQETEALRKIEKTIREYEADGTPVPQSVTDAKAVAARALQSATRETAAARKSIEKIRQKAVIRNLFQDEKDFLESHPDFDVLQEKCSIARQFFFKLYRIPETVEVNYDWSGGISEIKTDLVPNAPSGKTNVDRSYILPMVEYVDETRKSPGKDEEEKAGEKETKTSQSDKGKSASEKLRKGLGYQKQPVKEKIRARFWSYSYSKLAYGVYGFDSHKFKEISSKTVDIIPEHGLVLFHKVPYILADYAGWSEDCPMIFKACPVAAEFTYERKDPELGILNFFICELKKPADISGSPPARGKKNLLVEYEQIDEFVEHLLVGESKDRTQLVEVAKIYADEIWKKRVGMESAQARIVIPGPIDTYPTGPLQSVAWRTSPFTTTLEINTDYQKFVGATLTSKIKRALKEKGLWHRTETSDQHLTERRGFYSLPHTERFQDDERRILINTPHFGTFVIYDPKQKEDVIAVSASLADPATHTHNKWWLGPLLCRTPSDLTTGIFADPVLAYGHFWWAENGADLCGGGHSHAIGGFYYPWVRIPDPITGPPVIINKAQTGEFPVVEWLEDEMSGSDTSFTKVLVFQDNQGVDPGLFETIQCVISLQSVPRDPPVDS